MRAPIKTLEITSSHDNVRCGTTMICFLIIGDVFCKMFATTFSFEGGDNIFIILVQTEFR